MTIIKYIGPLRQSGEKIKSKGHIRNDSHKIKLTLQQLCLIKVENTDDDGEMFESHMKEWIDVDIVGGD